MTKTFPSKDTYYTQDPEENWFVREDVAGYEYPGEGDNYRIGVTREVIQTEDDVAPLFDILNAPFNESIRINVARAVITKALLQYPPILLQPLLVAGVVESVIPLEGCGNPDLADCYEIIFSRNHESRQTPVAVVYRELVAAEQVFAKAKTKPFHPTSLDRVKATYSFERITANSSPKLLLQYGSLIKATFGYELESTDFLLDDDNFLVGAVTEQSGPQVVAAGAFAWRIITRLKRNGLDIVLNKYEISGAVVREEYRGRGLYKRISVALLKILAQLSKPVDVVYGYSNIEEPSVLAVAAQTGRTPVTEPARQLNLSIKPTMQQNRVKGKYVDDIVTYMPGEQLRKLYKGNEVQTL